MNLKLLLESKFLHKILKNYYSTNYIIYCIIKLIVVKIIISQIIFFSW
jgi:hypothetical protein